MLFFAAAPLASSRPLTTASGVAWTIKCSANCPSSLPSSIPAQVPGVAHLSLMDAGLLKGDPLYRYNELEWSWVAEADWTYEGSFNSTSAEVGATGAVRLEGLDTIASVSLNGVHLGDGNDAHISWRFPVPEGVLITGTNTLTVAITSALRHANTQAAAYPYAVPASIYYHTWSEACAGGWNTSGYPDACPGSHRNFVRKTPADFGWDWGPSFVPAGITGGVTLEGGRGTAAAQLEGVAVRQLHHANGSVSLTVAARLATPADGAAISREPQRFRVRLCHPSCDGDGSNDKVEVHEAVVEAIAPGVAHEAEGAGLRVVLLLRQPRLWWPRGYGDPFLYHLRASLARDGVEDDGDIEEEKEKKGEGGVSIKVGLRTVELVQQPAQPPAPGLAAGTSFFFRVNGVDVYAKGSNWIPTDVFEPRATTERLRWLLTLAAGAHMNMLRVWGGGRYQPDAFYEIADELGLMVWQELLFACAMYPRDAAFLGLVAREVSEQVQRLSHHASVVIWGGSNENEFALSWYNESIVNRDLYLVDYVKLYLDTLRPAVAAADAGPGARPFVDSSPSNELVATAPYVKRWDGGGAGGAHSPQAASWGDVHYYDYDADCEDPDSYPLARFISEHGVQSQPSFRSYANVTAADGSDWSRDAPLLFWRQRHQLGNEQILAQITRHFRVPPANVSQPAASASAPAPASASTTARQRRREETRSQRDVFDDYLWLTQLQQARCYETAFAQWRRQRSQPTNTMGILYWQLNDIWPGPSWSSIEHDGTPKLTHHAVRRAYMPLLLSAREDNVSSASASTASVAVGARGEVGVAASRRVVIAGASRNGDGVHAKASSASSSASTSSAAAAAAAAAASAAAVSAAAASSPARNVTVHLTSDLSDGVAGTLTVARHAWAATTAKPIAQWSAPVSARPLASSAVWSAALDQLAPTAADRTSGFLRLSFMPSASAASEPAAEAVTGYHWLSQFKDAELLPPAIAVSKVAQTSDTTATVVLRSQHAAAFVAVESGVAGAFSDGAFTMLPATDYPLTFTARTALTAKQWAAFGASLRVRSLRDTYD